MRQVLRIAGKILYFCGWPAFWVYHRMGHGRTRVVLVHKGNILVMKQWIGNGKWHLPGGGLHKGEDVAEGAARELSEETSVHIRPENLVLAGRAHNRQTVQNYEYTVFYARVQSSKVRAQWYEVSELAWVKPEDLNESNATGDTLHSIGIVRKKTSLVQ